MCFYIFPQRIFKESNISNGSRYFCCLYPQYKVPELFSLHESQATENKRNISYIHLFLKNQKSSHLRSSSLNTIYRSLNQHKECSSRIGLSIRITGWKKPKSIQFWELAHRSAKALYWPDWISPSPPIVMTSLTFNSFLSSFPSTQIILFHHILCNSMLNKSSLTDYVC